MEGIKIYGVTPDVEKIKKNKNVNDVYRKNIDIFKKWSRSNFYFELNLVRYLNENMNVDLPPIPIDLDEEVIYDKKQFDTPFSHLLYIAFLVGKKMQVDDSEAAIKKLCEDFGTNKPSL